MLQGLRLSDNPSSLDRGHDNRGNRGVETTWPRTALALNIEFTKEKHHKPVAARRHADGIRQAEEEIDLALVAVGDKVLATALTGSSYESEDSTGC